MNKSRCVRMDCIKAWDLCTDQQSGSTTAIWSAGRPRGARLLSSLCKGRHVLINSLDRVIFRV